LHNQRDASLAKHAQVKVLAPLLGANHGDDDGSDEIQLIGIPKGETIQRIPDLDIFQCMIIEG
jgi:hypothetical protein